MKPKIALLRGNVVAPELQFSRASSVTQIRRVERRMIAKPTCTPSRAVLTMTWRVNPTSGRLECHWRAHGGTATDEGVSCSHLARWAA
jgi:hypothetical protein